MSRPLLRACLDCRTATRGKERCIDCQRRRDQAKRAKRPGLKTYTEQQRRARAVAEWRATMGAGARAFPSYAVPPARPPTCRPITSRRSAWAAPRTAR
jgi:hypothetical protein